MLQPLYSAKSFGRRYILPVAIALALSGVMLSAAQAARVGHARVVSAELASPKPSKTAANNVASVIVREGDTLFDIAGRYSFKNATRYQIMATLLHANPQAFVQGNMNLLKAGAKLSLPDSDQVLNKDPERARQLYKQQAQAYAEYRGRLDAQVEAGDSIETGRHATKGKVTDAPGVNSAGQVAPAQDRVRLSTDKNTEAKDDACASEAKALKDAEGRVATLQSNVEALNQLANKPSAAEKPATGQDSAAKVEAEAAKGETQTSAQDGAASSSLPSSVTVSSPTAASTQDKPPRNMAKDKTDADWTSILPAWLVDNLLVFVTAALALIAFIFAWLLRRTGARR
jgi:pilus assembly protein FimV